MSHGLGRVESWIVREISIAGRRHKPDPVLISSWGLACNYMPPLFGDCGDGPSEVEWKPTPAQRKAVVRAMHSFVRKFPQYALIGGKGRKSLFLYKPDDPLSATWARLSIERRFVTRDEAQQQLDDDARRRTSAAHAVSRPR